MKALVLSGGAGTRLRPITHTSAKQLLPVANKPVLFYGLEAIRDAGITDVGIVVGDTAEAIKAALGDGSAFGLSTTYIRQTAPLGLAHAVLVSRDFLGDDDFVMYLGDNFIVGGITSLVAEFRSERPDAQILLTQVPDPREFGVAELDETGQVVGLEEKPRAAEEQSRVGRCVHLRPFGARGSPESQAVMARGTGDHRGHPVAHRARQHGSVLCHLRVLEGHRQRNRHARGQPHGAGDERTLRRLQGTVDAGSEIIGRVVIDSDAQVSGSRIVGPVIIGPRTKVTSFFVEPFTAVAEDCTIDDSEIEYSIVLPRASIRGVRRIEASIIGREVEVTPAPRVPKAHRLVLGDHSKVQISS